MNKYERVAGFGESVEVTGLRAQIAAINEEAVKDAFRAVTNESLVKFAHHLDQAGIPRLEMLNNVSDQDQLFVCVQELTNATEWDQQAVALDQIVQLVESDEEALAA